MVAGKFEGQQQRLNHMASTHVVTGLPRNAVEPHRSGTKLEILAESIQSCWQSDPQTTFCSETTREWEEMADTEIKPRSRYFQRTKNIN